MTSMNVTNARKKLYSIIEEVNVSHTPIHITGKNGSAVILSEDDWNAIAETLHLSSIPGMTKSIKEGMKEPLDKCSDSLEW